MILLKSNPNTLHTVAKALLEQQIVIIPTDTVYGFSGIVPHTDSAIRVIKGREETKPFIQLLANPSDLQKYTSSAIPSSISKHMPGPITVIVKNKSDENTTAFRCPDDEWLQSLISLCKVPLYSTSTNRSGQEIISDISVMEKEFGKEIFCVVNDENLQSKDALPSTIVDISKGEIKVIRQGSVIL